MNFIKEWTICICVTLVIAIFLNYLGPSIRNGKFYKTLIKIFVLFAFIYPFSTVDFNAFSSCDKNYTTEYYDYQLDSANNLLKIKILDELRKNNISGSIVKINSYLNENEEIEVTKIEVIIPDEYECKDIKKIIYDSLFLDVDVIHIG